MSRKREKDKKGGLPSPPSAHPDLPTPPPTPPAIFEEETLKPSVLTGAKPPDEESRRTTVEVDSGIPLDASLLSELKSKVDDIGQKGLGGVLSKAEIEEKSPLFDQKKEYQKTAEEYEAAGYKQEESGLYTNAAVFFACSSAASALAEGPATAAMKLSQYARQVSSTTVNHPLFQSAKIGLKGALTNDNTKIVKAIRLMEGVDFFSREDKSLFKKFLRKIAR